MVMNPRYDKFCTIVIEGASAHVQGLVPWSIIIDATSYFSPGYRFSPQYRTGRWDGRVKLFRQSKRSFPAGLVHDVKTALKAKGIQVSIDDQRNRPAHKTLGVNCDIDISLDGVKFDPPYDFQPVIASKMLRAQRGVVAVATNGGKCLDPETPVLTYWGEIKAIKEIKEGDLLMGPDSEPRAVEGLVSGTDEMFKITPNRGGDAFTCNSKHLLTIRDSQSKNVIDVSISEFLTWSKNRQRYARLIRPKVIHFLDPDPRHSVRIDPWLIGLWVANGKKNLKCLEFLTSEDLIIGQLRELGKEHGLGLRTVIQTNRCSSWVVTGGRGKSNYLLGEFRSLFYERDPDFRTYDLSLWGLPTRLLTGTYVERLRFLAGILDGDGISDGEELEIVQEREQWANDIAFLARSLGFGVSVTCKETKLEGYDIPDFYWRVCISGDSSKIPFVLPCRHFKSKKQQLRVGFTVDPQGVGEYCGFSLDGDGRFLLGDFTVTHNTEVSCLVTAALRIPTLFIVPGKDLLYQTRKRFQKRLGLNDQSVGIIGDSKWSPGSWITIGTAKSLVNSLKKAEGKQFLDKIQLLFADECFPAGTRVGDKLIEDLRKGDLVSSFDENTGVFVRKKVVRLFSSRPTSLVRVCCGKKKIVCTLGHPFWTQRGWVSASNLVNPDSVLTHGKVNGWVPIRGVTTLGQTNDGTFGGECPDGFVYNIEVEETHTYLVEGVVVHNCHHVGSDSWFQVFRACDAFFRFGLSGTPLKRTDGADLRLIGSTGPVIVEVRNKELIERGISSEVEIRFVKITEPKLPWGTPYIDAYNLGISDNPIRTAQLCEVLDEFPDYSILILVKELNHGEAFAANIPSSRFISGKESAAVREEALRAFTARELNVLIATTILDEGIDVPNIDVLVLGGGGKSSIKTMQRIGRGLRTGGKTNKLIVIETSDFQNEQYLLEHSLRRFLDYKAENCFDIKVIK